MNKKHYEIPQIDVVKLTTADVLVESQYDNTAFDKDYDWWY